MAEEHSVQTTTEPHTDHHDNHVHSDTVEIMGRTITVMGGIYTVIFGVLAALTVIEVLVALVQIPVITGALLLIMALVKATLVMLFYMHLKDDSRIFALALAVPGIITLLSILYLIAIPPTGY
jgi:cytochrome c oxidase subunit 4